MTAISEDFNLAFVGNSIIFTPGGLTTNNGQLPAHTNNFLEIMADGSARMRILLLNNNQDDSTVVQALVFEHPMSNTRAFLYLKRLNKTVF